MKKLYIPLILITIQFMFFACGSSKKDIGEQQAASQSKMPQNTNLKIAPNHCRIVGRIVSVDENYRSENPEDPCSKAPCSAVVRVESIIGYGSAFGQPLAIGKEIKVLFRFTLNPTKDIVPGLSRHLPGLSSDSVFTADVESKPDVFEGEKKPNSFRYFVNMYEIKK